MPRRSAGWFGPVAFDATAVAMTCLGASASACNVCIFYALVGVGWSQDGRRQPRCCWASACHRTAGAIQHSLVGLPFSYLFGLVFICLHGNLVQFGNGDTVGARSVHMIRCPVCHILSYLSYFVGIIWAIQSLFHSGLQEPCPG